MMTQNADTATGMTAEQAAQLRAERTKITVRERAKALANEQAADPTIPPGMRTMTPRAHKDAPQLEPASNASPGEVRSKILITQAESDAFDAIGNRSRQWIPMHDHLSGLDLDVRPADCSLPRCSCDAEYRLADAAAAEAERQRVLHEAEHLAASGLTPAMVESMTRHGVRMRHLWHAYFGRNGRPATRHPLVPGESRWGHGGVYLMEWPLEDATCDIDVFAGPFWVYSVDDERNGSATVWAGCGDDAEFNELADWAAQRVGLEDAWDVFFTTDKWATGQRAMLALKIVPMYEEEGARRRERKSATTTDSVRADLHEQKPFRSTTQAGSAAKVSGRAVAQAKRIAAADPVLAQQVADGTKNLNKAEAEARQIEARRRAEEERTDELHDTIVRLRAGETIVVNMRDELSELTDGTLRLGDDDFGLFESLS
jgi:hypothetical protein